MTPLPNDGPGVTPVSHFMIARDQRVCARQRAFYQEQRPGGFMQRQFEIDALPSVEWKGRPLKSIVCCECKRVRNVPEGLLWALISLQHFRCEWCVRYGNKTG